MYDGETIKDLEFRSSCSFLYILFNVFFFTLLQAFPVILISRRASLFFSKTVNKENRMQGLKYLFPDFSHVPTVNSHAPMPLEHLKPKY